MGLMDAIIKEDIDQIKRTIDPEPFHEKTVLVSGGSGFLGSWICDVLSLIGSRVICLDNLSTGVFENVEHLKGTKRFEFLKGHVCEYASGKKFDLIFHLASRPAPEDYQKHPVETAMANSEGTKRMLEQARKGDTRVLYASSSEVYGDPEVFPTPESYEGKVDPLGPRSCYEEGKRFGETLCKAYHDQYGVDVRIARIFNCYGPRLRADGLYGRVVSRFILQSLKGEEVTVFGDGSQTRSFCYVSDTVSGLLRLIISEKSVGRAVNIGTTAETKVIDLARKIISLVESESEINYNPFPPGDHHRRLPDVERASRILGWNPHVDLDDGLDRTINWFCGNKPTLGNV